MKVDILNIQGQQTGKQVELPEDIFGIELNEHVLYLAVKQYNAHQRQGTHKSKERGEIRGSTRKIKRQKGTGTARAGSMNNPLFVGGGRVFGPRPRKYNIKLNKKVKTLARKCALSAKMKAGQVLVVEDFSFDAPKTKEFIKILNNLGVADKKCLFVNAANDSYLHLSCRNLPKTSMTTADSMNVYELLNANCLIIAEGSVDRMKETLSA